MIQFRTSLHGHYFSGLAGITSQKDRAMILLAGFLRMSII
jgi:hypothetical protein